MREKKAMRMMRGSGTDSIHVVCMFALFLDQDSSIDTCNYAYISYSCRKLYQNLQNSKKSFRATWQCYSVCLI